MTMKPLPQHTHLPRLPIAVQKNAIPVPQDTLELRLSQHHSMCQKPRLSPNPCSYKSYSSYTSTTEYPAPIHVDILETKVILIPQDTLESRLIPSTKGYPRNQGTTGHCKPGLTQYHRLDHCHSLPGNIPLGFSSEWHRLTNGTCTLQQHVCQPIRCQSLKIQIMLSDQPTKTYIPEKATLFYDSLLHVSLAPQVTMCKLQLRE